MSLQSTPAECPLVDLGAGYNPFVAPQLDDPFPVWAQARAEQPVFYSDVLDAWVVTRYADVITVLRDPQAYGQIVERKVGITCPEADAILAQLPRQDETSANSSDPPVHTKLRRYLQPAFQPHRISARAPELRALAHSLVDEFEPRGHGDIYQDYTFRYPLMTIFQLIDLPHESMQQVKQWGGDRMALRWGNLSDDEQVRAAEGQRDYVDFTLDLVARRRVEPGDDFLSWIIADSDSSDDPLTDEQLASQIVSLTTAGHESTSHWLTMTLQRVLPHRDLWAGLVDDPAKVEAVVEEALRLVGPAQGIWRRTRADVELGGVHIPQGTKVHVVLASANVDGEVFEAGEEFRPDRPNIGQSVAFGRGIHTCVGAGLARLEGCITLEVLATRLPNLRLASADGGILYRPSSIQRMAQRLYVEWD